MRKLILIDFGVLIEYEYSTDQYSVDSSPVRVFEPLGENTKYILNSDENVDTKNIRDNSTFLINPTLSQYYLLNDDNVATSYTENTNTLYANSIVPMTGINMEYDTLTLRLDQTFSYNSNAGMHFRIYTEYNGRVVNLASHFDLSTNSNIISSANPIRLDRAFYTSELSIKVPTLDFICQSDNSEVEKIRLELFGTVEKISTPTLFVEIHIVDELETTTGNYRRFVVDQVERVGFSPKPENSGIFPNCSFDENNILQLATGYNGRGTIQTYLNTLGEIDDAWQIDYHLNIVGLDAGVRIQNDFFMIRNKTDFTLPVPYYPILSNAVDGANINVIITIENIRTKLILYREINLPVIEVDIYKVTKPTTNLNINVDVIDAYNKVVNVTPLINTNNRLSSANTVIKPIFVNQLILDQELTLYEQDSNIIFELTNDQVESLRNVNTLYLDIGGERIQEKKRPSVNKIRFKIPKSFYTSNVSRYYIVDESEDMVATGLVVKG